MGGFRSVGGIDPQMLVQHGVTPLDQPPPQVAALADLMARRLDAELAGGMDAPERMEAAPEPVVGIAAAPPSVEGGLPPSISFLTMRFDAEYKAAIVGGEQLILTDEEVASVVEILLGAYQRDQRERVVALKEMYAKQRQGMAMSAGGSAGPNKMPGVSGDTQTWAEGSTSAPPSSEIVRWMREASEGGEQVQPVQSEEAGSRASGDAA